MNTRDRPLTTGWNVANRDEVWRHLCRRPRPHPQRRDSRQARSRCGERGRCRGVRHGGGHQSARGALPGPVAAARRAGIRHGCRDRRTGDHWPPGDCASADRYRGALVAGLANSDPHRQCPRQGPHRRHRGRRVDPSHEGGTGRRGVRLPGRRHRQSHHHPGSRWIGHLGSRPGSRTACGSLRYLHRRRRRLYY